MIRIPRNRRWSESIDRVMVAITRSRLSIAQILSASYRRVPRSGGFGSVPEIAEPTLSLIVAQRSWAVVRSAHSNR